ncbi:MAG TPA: DMT family transporter [Candidatus Cloacimonadota bacterium]|nr:DMT family transporter [Candidatus Cloacimonadota bacterium]
MKLWFTYFRAIAAMFFWAITFVWYKIAFETYRPYEVIFLRLLLGAGLLCIVMLISSHWQKIQRRDMWRFLLVAFFEPFLYFIGEANGMQYVSSTLGSLIIALIPIFAAIGAWILLKETITRYVIAGLIVSFSGVAILSIGSGELTATLKGVLLLMIAIFGAVGYGLTVRPLTLKYSTLTIVAYQSLIGMLYFLPLFIIYDGSHFFSVQHSFRGLSTIAMMSICATVGAFLLYTDVIRTLGVAKANIFTYLIPVFTVGQAYFILAEPLTARTIAGIGLTLLGLVISQYHDLRKLKKRVLEYYPWI